MKKIIVFIALLFTVGCSRNIFHADISVVSNEIGEVIYSCNKESSNQVFIIALSHRGTLTRANGENTVKSQVEVYRIGEWLIQKEGLELLLPEGFFSDKNNADENIFVRKDAKASFNTETLKKELGREDAYINAEMLLKESYGVKTREVDDLNLYNSVVEQIKFIERYSKDSFEVPYIGLELNYLQERRTAAMLQKIPEAIEGEYEAGRIKNKKAIFTIGLSHISAIMKYLKQGRIEIASPAFSPYDDYSSGVELLEKYFGVTIIIPKSLIKLQTDG